MILRPENESLDPSGTFWSPGCKPIGCIFRSLEASEGRVCKRFSLIESSRRDSEGNNLQKIKFFKKFQIFFYVS